MREFDLLKHVYASNPRLDRWVTIPPGDDMAQIELRGTALLVATDQLVAGRHVTLETTPLELVGRKAVARSLSDIAAMAGRPVASLAAVTLPPEFGESNAQRLFDAMREIAEAHGCPLIGGDIAMHGDAAHPLVCSVTVLAEPSDPGAVTRDGASVGDDLYVTGRLGGAVDPDGTGRHLTFQPRIAEALTLLDRLGPDLHAMIDISDGLGRDAAHLAEQSDVSIRIDAQTIPRHDGIDWRRAASEGEDYELCFAAVGDVPTSIGDLPVTRIGSVVPRSGNGGGIVFHFENGIIPGDELGWQHES